jgi:hypothetical protein
MLVGFAPNYPKSRLDQPRQNFLSARGKLTRPCLIDISSTSHQGRTTRRVRPSVYQSQGRQIGGVTLTRYGRLNSPRV